MHLRCIEKFFLGDCIFTSCLNPSSSRVFLPLSMFRQHDHTLHFQEFVQISRPGKTLNSAAGLPARVQIPVPPSATSRLLYELLGRVRLRFLVVSPFRIACVFLHVERGRSSKRVWRSPRIIYLFIYHVTSGVHYCATTGKKGHHWQ
jgi:hypothetical protein